MQTSMKTKSLIFILAILSSGLSQGMTWEEWAESRHPPATKVHCQMAAVPSNIEVAFILLLSMSEGGGITV